MKLHASRCLLSQRRPACADSLQCACAPPPPCFPPPLPRPPPPPPPLPSLSRLLPPRLALLRRRSTSDTGRTPSTTAPGRTGCTPGKTGETRKEVSGGKAQKSEE